MIGAMTGSPKDPGTPYQAGRLGNAVCFAWLQRQDGGLPPGAINLAIGGG